MLGSHPLSTMGLLALGCLLGLAIFVQGVPTDGSPQRDHDQSLDSTIAPSLNTSKLSLPGDMSSYGFEVTMARSFRFFSYERDAWTRSVPVSSRRTQYVTVETVTHWFKATEYLVEMIIQDGVETQITEDTLDDHNPGEAKKTGYKRVSMSWNERIALDGSPADLETLTKIRECCEFNFVTTFAADPAVTPMIMKREKLEPTHVTLHCSPGTAMKIPVTRECSTLFRSWEKEVEAHETIDAYVKVVSPYANQ
ncbi:uncharacterized protein L969DRAFT_256250 [Mixia osmundae IAM 14324]|uniref:Secreted protein n=1 Tax=Mixia osmundae (strain CBS 9802 / IAM 14324 / JCM 22182 / KY 12970) TaxID=764103 RepID=G7DW30_MIXOS|nr:uncharacterized protein L969DRAFT_256250 [Mixia osmundae IAM 14324]KEI36464.1 hypothetical protein L969DRAFT_256250 [Mixia osmundae IAM 14324]GAA94836.1 hypothetical protein E5Q_01490 [Mixia osmundae IAM 14324]